MGEQMVFYCLIIRLLGCKFSVMACFCPTKRRFGGCSKVGLRTEDRQLRTIYIVHDLFLSGQVVGHLVEGEGVVDGVVAHLLAAQGAEEGAAAEGQAQVARQAADVGALAAMDAEVGLRQVRGDGALGVVVEVTEWLSG